MYRLIKWGLLFGFSLMAGCMPSPNSEQTEKLHQLLGDGWRPPTDRHLLMLSLTQGCGPCMKTGKKLMKRHYQKEDFSIVLIAPTQKEGRLFLQEAGLSSDAGTIIKDPTQYSFGLIENSFALFFFEKGQCTHYEAATPNTAAQLVNKAERFLNGRAEE